MSARDQCYTAAAVKGLTITQASGVANLNDNNYFIAYYKGNEPVMKHVPVTRVMKQRAN